ncbi:alpha/beta fold hydrolase [Caldalkalibacillus mannanilyticus]|uniref:alpha/beta fold hydrolase n=1 Tax=Caldalkalibacillus mannanilyticus TaxID=1418 RepID=UPI0004683836|nr:alpha/beta hydrolase [Caldalkalibacillus mannanilyticus]
MSLHYIEHGNKNAPLLVFIHGGGVSSWMWDKQVEYFSSYHCLVPDLPDHGKSRSHFFSIDQSAQSIIELIEEKANGKQIHVVGFSLGAQILIAILSKKPTLIDSAIINSALVRPIPFANILIKSLMITYPLIQNRTFSKLQARSMYIDQKYFETYYQESCRLTKDDFERIMKENMSFTIPETFKKAKSKILVTVGEKEKRIMKKSLVDITNSNSNCKGVVIPKVGHGFSLANPKLFNKFIEGWFKQGTLLDDLRKGN